MSKLDNHWEGVFYRLTVSEQYDKELYRELSSMPPRLRSTRMKALALVGLYALSGKPTPAAQNSAPSEVLRDDESDFVVGSSSTDTIKDRLKGIAGKSLIKN